jgi:MFS family permease
LLPVFRAFQHRNFRLFFTGFAISMLGSWMQTLAQSWLVWRLTHSPVWLGVIGAMPQLPSLVLGPFGGVLVDRHFKRSVLIVTQIGMGLCAGALALFTLSGHITEWIVLIIAICTGIFVAIDTPARLSFAQDMVGKDDLGNAIALNSTTFNAARLIGPAIAGLLVPVIGEGGIFLINSISYLGLISTLLMMRDLPLPTATDKPVLVQIREAFLFVRTSPLHKILILNTALIAVIGFSYVPLLPVMADDILDVGVRGLGIMYGALGVGALIGGLRVAWVKSGAKRGRTVLIGAAGLTLFVITFAFSRWFPLSLLALAGAGYSFATMLTSTNTILQTYAPDELRGRVIGIYSTSFIGMLPLGNVLAGFTAEVIGAMWTMVGFATLTLLAVTLTIGRSRALRSV